MLRHYDQIGLLTPAQTDSATGYRYYDESQLPVANQIRATKDMGLGLAATREIIGCSDEQAVVKLEFHYIELQHEIAALNIRLRLTENKLRAMKNKAVSPAYHVSLKEIPAMSVMSCRGVLKGYKYEGELWEKLYAEMERQNARRSVPAFHIAVFHDESYMVQNIDVEVQCAVDGQYADKAGVCFAKREPVLAATVIYQGDYSELTDVNTEVAGWIAENRYTICGPGLNIYHISPGDTDRPENMVTEVCFPVAHQN